MYNSCKARRLYYSNKNGRQHCVTDSESCVAAEGLKPRQKMLVAEREGTHFTLALLKSVPDTLPTLQPSIWNESTYNPFDIQDNAY